MFCFCYIYIIYYIYVEIELEGVFPWGIYLSWGKSAVSDLLLLNIGRFCTEFYQGNIFLQPWTDEDFVKEQKTRTNKQKMLEFWQSEKKRMTPPPPTNP